MFNEQTDYSTTEILSGSHGSDQRIPVTIASGIGVLQKGQILGRYNAGVNSGLYGVYDNVLGANGCNAAVGILADKADATSSGVQCSMYTHGRFRKELMIGLDSAAETDLKNCEFVQ
jgi:hypothetical protein